MPKNRPPLPMETPGFGWRVGLSILVVFGWLVFLILWLLFYAGSFNVYQNLAAILVSILVGIAILAAAWVSWGIKYGWKYKEEWSEKGNKPANVMGWNMRGRACGGEGAFYGLGFVGALIYYVTTAPTFWEAVIGFFKAIVWPAFFVYEMLKFLGL